MKPKTLGLIHTSHTLIPVFQELCKQHLPGVTTFNIVDDSLVRNIRERGEVTPAIYKRVADYVDSAIDSGADYVLVTCSSIGAAIEAAAENAKVPVLRVDQPMADLAVQTGKRIGVIATLPTTLEPTSDLVKRRAAIAGKEIELTAKLCNGAFEALMSGDAATHDRIVADALRELSKQVDVILLAQASMARVVDTLSDEDKRVPIVASPPTAVKHLATVINN
ncbi:aspartate/glutamate racemase family protein [Mucilaginibacter boryungensis]|uniref:Aspartate/glutamate racemase family protein n=1 Tax=Mucilaginibacter boryungensis TaxID=768480 RepID=A0ABR9XJU9_9SPHI|nr:aspartate/glutamate racemase family protein [Mucilaginibacter boryungensis]MBE9667309.1 aspartate/glutamate racemase family protein [Mucilaginibacter boryungensis]